MRLYLAQITIYFCLLCFNLKHVRAQTQPAPAPTPAIQTQAQVEAQVKAKTEAQNAQAQAQAAQAQALIQAVRTAAPTPGTPGVPPGTFIVLPSAVSSPTNGKYFEYQSYCRGPLEVRKILSDNEYTLIKNNLFTAYTEKKSFSTFEQLLKHLLDNGKNKEATTLLVEEKKVFSPSEQIILQAKLSTAERKYREAITALEKLAPNQPNNAELLIDLSKNYYKLNNLFESKSALQDAIKLDKKNSSKYYYDLCVLESEDSNHIEAEADCAVVSKLSPKNSLPIIYLGISQREQMNYPRAQKQFEKALTLEKTEFALTCLGEIYFLQKDYKKAIEVFKQASELEPQSGRAQLGAAQSYYELRLYEEALPYFAKACQLDKTTSQKMREAQKPLESAKVKVSNEYYHEIQKCISR